MTIQTQINGSTEVIQLSGRVDFSLRDQLAHVINQTTNNPATSQIEVNFSAANYIDSSVCGMLLILRDKGKHAGKEITLAHASGPVKQVFEVANFHKLFTIR